MTTETPIDKRTSDRYTVRKNLLIKKKSWPKASPKKTRQASDDKWSIITPREYGQTSSHVEEAAVSKP